MKGPGFEIPQMTFEVRKIISYQNAKSDTFFLPPPFFFLHPPKKTSRGHCHFSIHFQLPPGIPYQENSISKNTQGTHTQKQTQTWQTKA